MKAKRVVVSARGSVDTIVISEYTVSEPQEAEVLVKVAYAGLAFADIMLRTTRMAGLPEPPFTPGADAVGTVEKVGSGVKSFKKGDRVALLLMAELGAQSQYLTLNESSVYPIPDDVSFDKALCMLVNYLTAYQMLNSYSILDSAKPLLLLIHGATGGVGSALVQLAQAYGHHCFATGSLSNASYELLHRDKWIDYKSEDFVSKMKSESLEVDVVCDPIGAAYLGRSLKVLKKGGIYIGYGFHSVVHRGMAGIVSALIEFMWRRLITFDKKIVSFQLSSSSKKNYREGIESLYKLYQEKKIDPLIGEAIAFEDAKRAHKLLEEGRRMGKIVIKM